MDIEIRLGHSNENGKVLEIKNILIDGKPCRAFRAEIKCDRSKDTRARVSYHVQDYEGGFVFDSVSDESLVKSVSGKATMIFVEEN